MRKLIGLFVLCLFLTGFTWTDNHSKMSSVTIGAASSSSCYIALGSVTVTGTIAQQTDNQTGDLTESDETVTDTDTSGFEAGWTVTGTGVPASTMVASITSGSEFEMSNAATATGGDVAMSFSYDYNTVVSSVASTNYLHKGMSGGGTIASVDSGTQFTLSSNRAIGASQSLTFDNDYDSVLISVKIVGDSGADSADIEFFSSSDEGTTWTTEAFYTKELTGLASDTQTFSYRASAYLYPRIKITITNNTTESGSDDDIVATVNFAGYEN